MISVAMTTYNGEKFIVKQLDSIRKQTMKPNEVFICDDCSTDLTPILIEEYINKWELKDWYFISNKKNVGWKENFYNALELTKGDVVFFCDQDDIWDYEKIEKMVAVLDANNNIEVLCCTTSFIDGCDNKIEVSKDVLPYGSNEGPLLKRNTINNRFIYTIMPGCTMCVKRNLIIRLNSVISDNETVKELPHDAMFWKVGTLEGTAYIYNNALIKYRIHTSNCSSPQTKSSFKVKTKSKRKKEIDTNSVEISLVLLVYSKLGNSKYTKFLKDLLFFCEWRKKLVDERSFWGIFAEIKYYRSVKMLFGDIMASFAKE